MTRSIVSQKTLVAEAEGRLPKSFGIGQLCSASVIFWFHWSKLVRYLFDFDLKIRSGQVWDHHFQFSSIFEKNYIDKIKSFSKSIWTGLRFFFNSRIWDQLLSFWWLDFQSQLQLMLMIQERRVPDKEKFVSVAKVGG